MAARKREDYGDIKESHLAKLEKKKNMKDRWKHLY